MLTFIIALFALYLLFGIAGIVYETRPAVRQKHIALQEKRQMELDALALASKN